MKTNQQATTIELVEINGKSDAQRLGNFSWEAANAYYGALLNQSATNPFQAISDWIHTATAAIPAGSPFANGCSKNMEAADELLLKLQSEHAALLAVAEAAKWLASVTSEPWKDLSWERISPPTVRLNRALSALNTIQGKEVSA